MCIRDSYTTRRVVSRIRHNGVHLAMATAYVRRRRRITHANTTTQNAKCAHGSLRPDTLQHPPLSGAHRPAPGPVSMHARSLGHVFVSSGLHASEQILASLPTHLRLLHCCAYSQVSPTSSVGGSHKHLPASHF